MKRFNLDPEQLTEEEKLLGQCKEYCLSLISSAEKTEMQLRRKLKNSGKYPAGVMEEAIGFLKTYGYLDDARYARQYADFYQNSRSKKEIEKKLYEKGIHRDIIHSCMEEMDEDAELIAAEKFLKKKCPDPRGLDQAETKKLYAALMRKGFSYQTVRKLLSVEDYD